MTDTRDGNAGDSMDAVHRLAEEGKQAANPEPVRKDPSDTPISLEKLKELGRTNYFVTPAAHRWMVSEKLDRTDNAFNKELRYVVLQSRIKGLGRQLTLAETKDAVMFLRNKKQEENKRHEEFEKLLDLRADSSSPNKDEEICYGKVVQTCPEKFKPTARYRVGGTPPRRFTENGSEVQLGNYAVLPIDKDGNISESGELKPVGICKECALSDGLRGTRLYTWEGAIAVIEKIKADQAAEKDRSQRADLLRRSLVAPDGKSPRFNTGYATADMDQTARFLEGRRGKAGFQGSRNPRRK